MARGKVKMMANDYYSQLKLRAPNLSGVGGGGGVGGRAHVIRMRARGAKEHFSVFQNICECG